jgi:hypothetical protein
MDSEFVVSLSAVPKQHSTLEFIGYDMLVPSPFSAVLYRDKMQTVSGFHTVLSNFWYLSET